MDIGSRVSTTFKTVYFAYITWFSYIKITCLFVCLFEVVLMHHLYLKLNYHRGNIYQNRESIHDYTTKHPCVYMYVNRYNSVGLINVNKSLLIHMSLMIYILNMTNQYNVICIDCLTFDF